MINSKPAKCPQCGETAPYSKRRSSHYCAECDLVFDAPKPAVEPQTIFLSYAHKSELEEDFDVSEELVLLMKSELDKDGHTVWIDKEGIRSGSQWRERITSAIYEHAHFLSFLSRRSVRDPGVCLNEIATALGAKKNIQTVLAEAERAVAPPLTISHLQWHDFQDWREIRAGTKTGPNGEDWEAWFAQRMALVRDAVGDAQNVRVSGQLQRLKDILVPTEFEARIIEKSQGFYGRQWLFDTTRTWLDESTSRMFWLKAGPGIGKSSFAAKLTHQASSAVIGFFMCDFQGKKDPEESAREAICTLAFQMASRLPDYRLKLIYQQQVDKEKILKKSADDLFEYLITEPLNKSGKIPEATRLCLVIDGLDEAGRSDHGNALADLLVKHVNRLPEWLGVIVTSRPEPYLEQMLKPLSGISVDGQSEQNRQDLAAWIDGKLAAHLKGDERQRVIDAVIDKSGGTFLYLRLVEEDQLLDISKPETLPDKLDGIFKQNFNRYFPDPEEYGNKTEPFLRLMVAAPGPLPAQMGRQIRGWSQRDLTIKVIEPLGSLLQERDGGLVFFHASLSDWLKDPKRSGTHCVNDTGGQELGEFIWKQFEDFDNSEWTQLVVRWLATLMRHTKHWDEIKELRWAAKFLGKKWRYRDVIVLRQRQLERIGQAQGADSLEAAICLHAIGDSKRLIGESAGGLAQFRSAHAILERLASEAPDNARWQIDLSRTYLEIGDILRAQGDLAGALAEYRRGLTINERLVAQDPENADWQINLGRIYGHIGRILDDQGNLAGALAEYRKGLSINQRLVSQAPDNAGWQSDLGVSYELIGGILKSKGDLAGALAEFRNQQFVMESLSEQDPENARWQRGLGLSYNRIGDILKAQGDLSGALAEFRKGLTISERLAAQDLSNVDWQNDLGESYKLIGVILRSKGDLSGALAEFRKDLAINECLASQAPDNTRWQYSLGESNYHVAQILNDQGDLAGALVAFRKAQTFFDPLAAQDPTNADWQRSLYVCYTSAGVIFWEHGDLTGAVAEYRKGLTISERLAALAPENAGWQCELGGTYNSIGTILEAQGDLSGALAQFRKGLTIRERLAAQDPENAGWQSDLGVSYNGIGCILEAQGDLSVALAEFRKGLTIRERLAVQGPENAGWQRELGVSYNRIGSILEAQGDLSGALAEQRKYQLIMERLAAQDPENAGWQRDLGVSHCNIGDVLFRQSHILEARSEYLVGSNLFAKLCDPNIPGSVLDRVAAMARLADCHAAMGEIEALHALDLQIAEIDWAPDVITGGFRKKAIPRIVARLDAVFDRCVPALQERIARRCLAGLEAIGAGDLVMWRARIKQAILKV